MESKIFHPRIERQLFLDEALRFINFCLSPPLALKHIKNKLRSIANSELEPFIPPPGRRLVPRQILPFNAREKFMLLHFMIFYDILLFRAKCWKKITLKRRFPFKRVERRRFLRSWCLVTFSSSSFLQLRSMENDLHTAKGLLAARASVAVVFCKMESFARVFVGCLNFSVVLLHATQIDLKVLLNFPFLLYQSSRGMTRRIVWWPSRREEIRLWAAEWNWHIDLWPLWDFKGQFLYNLILKRIRSRSERKSFGSMQKRW